MSLIKKASRLATLCMMFLMSRKASPNPSERRGVQLVQRRISKEIIANLQQNRTSPPLEGLGEASSIFIF